MDFIVKHWAVYPRRFPSTCPLQGLGFIQNKDSWVRSAFTTCNFSLILRGKGEFHRKGRFWPVQGPCVITQWPGEVLQYGPALPDETWDELYLMYDASEMPALRRSGMVKERRPVWPIHNLDRVQTQVEELHGLINGGHPEMMVDRVDRVCERLILETLLPKLETGDEVIQKIQSQLRQQLDREPDFDALAQRCGMSPSTFRRRWFQALKTTPGRYLMDLRIQKARRMLAETMLDVGEIATRTGFEDRLYFSRRFKLETNLSPTEYRERYRLRPAG